MSIARLGSTTVVRGLLGGLCAAGALLATWPAISCGPDGEQRYQQRLARTGEPAMHAIHSARLRELMGKLTYDMSLDPPDRYTEPKRRAEQIVAVADEMVGTAGNVGEASAKFKLNEQDREVFLHLARKLKASALDIRNAASRENFDGTRAAINEMQSTCNACHSLFREEHRLLQ